MNWLMQQKLEQREQRIALEELLERRGRTGDCSPHALIIVPVAKPAHAHPAGTR